MSPLSLSGTADRYLGSSRVFRVHFDLRIDSSGSETPLHNLQQSAM